MVDHRKRSISDLKGEGKLLEDAEKNIHKDTEKIKTVNDKLRAFLDQAKGATSDLDQKMNEAIREKQGKLIEDEQNKEKKDSEDVQKKADEKVKLTQESITKNEETRKGLEQHKREFEKVGIKTDGFQQGDKEIHKENTELQKVEQKVTQDKKDHQTEMEQTQNKITEKRKKEVKLQQATENFNSGPVTDKRASGAQRGS